MASGSTAELLRKRSNRSFFGALSLGLAVLSAGGGSLLGASCGDDAIAAVAVTPAPYGAPYDKLSEWHLFADGTKQLPAERVIPYEVNSPLFSDYTTKLRFVFIPEKEHITYDPDNVWELPVGSILVKTFGYLADNRDPNSKYTLLETRILYHEPDGWTANTYVWDADQKDATKNVAGPMIPSTFVDTEGKTQQNTYLVPNSAQCLECHAKQHEAGPLGWKTRQLNRAHVYESFIGEENQIDHFQGLGLFKKAAQEAQDRSTLVDPYGDAPLSDRARSYLDANCAHCHSANRFASSTGLFLDFASTDPAKDKPVNWGTCKSPTSAGKGTCGNTFDVVPGDPDHSILICRVSSDDATTRMPLLGVNMVNQEGVALLRDWVTHLPATSCPAE